MCSGGASTTALDGRSEPTPHPHAHFVPCSHSVHLFHFPSSRENHSSSSLLFLFGLSIKWECLVGRDQGPCASHITLGHLVQTQQRIIESSTEVQVGTLCNRRALQHTVLVALTLAILLQTTGRKAADGNVRKRLLERRAMRPQRKTKETNIQA